MNIEYVYGILFRDKTEKAWSIWISEFRPQSRVTGPQILGSKNSFIPYFSPNFGLTEPKVFGPLEV